MTAIRYQSVVMYMLLAATALATLASARLAERALFDHVDHAPHLVPSQIPRTSRLSEVGGL